MTPTAPSFSRRKLAVVAAFVLIGLVIVMVFAMALYQNVVRTKEVLLESNLHTLSQTIEQYTHDNKRPPTALRTGELVFPLRSTPQFFKPRL